MGIISLNLCQTQKVKPKNKITVKCVTSTTEPERLKISETIEPLTQTYQSAMLTLSWKDKE